MSVADFEASELTVGVVILILGVVGLIYRTFYYPARKEREKLLIDTRVNSEHISKITEDVEDIKSEIKDTKEENNRDKQKIEADMKEGFSNLYKMQRENTALMNEALRLLTKVETQYEQRECKDGEQGSKK